MRRGPTSPYRLWHYWLGFYGMSQQATFFRRSLLSQTGFLDQTYHYALDYDLLIRATLHTEFAYTEQCLASFRKQSESKTSQGWLPFEIEHGRMLLGPHREVAIERWGDGYVRVVAERYADALLTSVCHSRVGPSGHLLGRLWLAAKTDARMAVRADFWKAVLLGVVGRRRYDAFRNLVKRLVGRVDPSSA